MTEHAKAVQPKKDVASRNGETGHYGSIVEANQEGMARWFQTMTSLGEEVAQFTQNRWHEDLAAWTELAGCTSPMHALACQRNFAEKAMAQYSDEIARLSRLMMNLATDRAAPTGHDRDAAR